MALDIIAVIAVPAVLMVFVAAAVARRRTPTTSESDSVSFIGGVLSALFTVVLAFYVVFAWQAGADIRSTSDTEANALIDCYRQADVGPGPGRDHMRGLLREYAAAVADREWNSLDTTGRDDPRLDAITTELRDRFIAMPAADAGTEFRREQGLDDLRQIDESHRSRVSAMGSVFNQVLLVGTIIGAVLMIGFPLLVGLGGRPVDLAVVAVLAAVLATIVFLAVLLARPLSGPFGANPGPFRDALSNMQQLT
ncbi:MAG TPA: hypothetical protein VGM60_01840 [Pseudonocardia sp.]|uniref:bestrophin-like domain n=1 Tax=Pseudonocardia sp. TaxID=60912 RepID=UPI002F3FC241